MGVWDWPCRLLPLTAASPPRTADWVSSSRIPIYSFPFPQIGSDHFFYASPLCYCFFELTDIAMYKTLFEPLNTFRQARTRSQRQASPTQPDRTEPEPYFTSRRPNLPLPITAQSIWSEIQLRRNWKVFFPLKYAILSFWKCLNNYILGFQRGDIF